MYPDYYRNRLKFQIRSVVIFCFFISLFFFRRFTFAYMYLLSCLLSDAVPATIKWVVLRCIKSGYRKLTRPLLYAMVQAQQKCIFHSFQKIFPVVPDSYYAIFNFVNLYLLIKEFSKVKAKWKITRKKTTRNQNAYTVASVRDARGIILPQYNH